MEDDLVARLRQLARQLATGDDFHNDRLLTAEDTMYWKAAERITELEGLLDAIPQIATFNKREAEKQHARAEAAEKRVAELEAETATLDAEYDASMADNAVQKAELCARAEAAEKLLRERDAFIVKTELWPTFLAWLARLEADKRRN